MKTGRILAIASLMCLFVLHAGAQSEFVKGYRRFDDSIRRFLMDGMDTSYVKLPANSFEVPVVAVGYGYNMDFGKARGLRPIGTGANFEVGAGIGYHGLDLVYTVGVGKNMDFHFEFDYYDNYWGLGINIGRGGLGDADGEGKYPLQLRSIMLEGYVALNGSRFSYPAACYGNYIQTKSAGSPVMSFWYDHYDYLFRKDLARDYFDSPDAVEYKDNSGALTFGYGYNFAMLGGRVLINATACAGMLFCSKMGLAANAHAGGMFWISEHARISLQTYAYYEKYGLGTDTPIGMLTWRGTLGLTYCFGMRR